MRAPKTDRRHRRSRSLSYDSEREQRRRRYHRRRDSADYGRPREENDKAVERNGYDTNYNKRRRSRSPSPYSRRRRRDETRHTTSNHRSAPQSSQDLDTSSGREDLKIKAVRKNKGPLPSQNISFQESHGRSAVRVVADEKPEKQKPNLAPTGFLAAASNSVVKVDGTAIALKYHEPTEARKPPAKDDWKLFVFKGSDIVESIKLSTRSCWLIGRDHAVADVVAEHPSVSKQHGVIQFRHIEKTDEYGDRHGRVRPYIIDLESSNGTLLNKEEIPASRYLELRDKDMIQFGHSSREYVLMLAPK